MGFFMKKAESIKVSSNQSSVNFGEDGDKKCHIFSQGLGQKVV